MISAPSTESLAEMPREWIRPDPSLSRTKLDAAGDLIAGRRDSGTIPSRDEALGIVNKWRASHGWPLNTVTTTLRGRARNFDPGAVIAQRLKRLSSIEAKLRRFPAMQLSQMQDIGGCRAVLATIDEVEHLVREYERGNLRNAKSGPEFVKKYDYLNSPKPDGYRGVHLVYRYRSRADHPAIWNGLRVEIQIRSQLQHAWATAVETVSTFTGQQLKADEGREAWKRFFALMGSALARRENRPTVKDTPASEERLVAEVRKLNNRLGVDTSLSAWQTAVRFLGTEHGKAASHFLLILDQEKLTMTVTSYTKREQEKASAKYLEYEKEVERNPNLNVVLASVESIAALRSAFPNYYADTTAFRQALTEVLAS